MANPSSRIRKRIHRVVLAGVLGFGILVASRIFRGGDLAAAAPVDEAAQMVVREYDITNLMMREQAPPANLAIVRPAEPSNPVQASWAHPGSFEEQARQIASKIENTVDTDSWKTRGSITFAVSSGSAKLIVSQAPATQKWIAGLLDKLHETRSLVLTLDSHLISIDPGAAAMANTFRKKIESSKVAVNPGFSVVAASGSPPEPGMVSLIAPDDAQVLLKSSRAVNGIEIRDIQSDFRAGSGMSSIREKVYPYFAGKALEANGKPSGSISAQASSGDLFDVVQGISDADHKHIRLDYRFQWSHFVRFAPNPSNADYQEPIEQLAQFDQRVTIPQGQYVLVEVPAPQWVTIKNGDMPAPRTTDVAVDKSPVEPSLFLLFTVRINPTAFGPATRPAME